MLKHYMLGIVLQCFCSVLFSQPCTLTQADLLAAPGAGFTIPSGAVLCINSNFCMGAASNFPGACANSNINSITVNGTLRIAANVSFNFAGSISGSGEIQILDRGRISLFGSINCTGGLLIKAVDRTLGSGSSTTPIPSCSSPVCQPFHTDGYFPFGIVTPGLGYTSTGCIVTNFPNNSILLPVALNSFQANAEGRGVRLTWSTASEQQNRGFEIQRSNAAGSWDYAGWVPSKAPEGNSAGNLHYTFTDQQPGDQSSVNYRLKQMDIDGNFKYSSTVRVEMLKAQEWRVRLEGNTIRVQVQAAAAENAVMTVVGVSGNVLYRKSHALNAGSNTILIPAGNFSKGLQVVSMQRSGGELRREKILIK